MGARELLGELAGAGLTIRADGDQLVIKPVSKLTDDMRAALRAAKPELMVLLTSAAPVRRFRLSKADADRCHEGGWNDAEIATFTARHVRLLAHGLTDGDANDLAERLTLRDRDRDDDERRLCVECAHYRGGRCRQSARSGVGPEVGALALVLQNCPAFEPMGDCHV